MQRRLNIGLMVLAQLAAMTLATPSNAAVANCDQIMYNRCHSEFNANKNQSHIDNYMESKDVYQCILRGYDAPINCRKDKGESAGVRVDGSSGFSYGTVQAPENSPGNTGSAPTVTKNSIKNHLGFDFVGCKVYNIDLCDDPPPPPLDMTKLCPEKDDPNDRLGTKTPVSASALDLACGAAVPLSNYEVSMNANPDRVAVTEFKSYTLRMYRKSNGTYNIDGDYWEEVTVLDPPEQLGVVMDDKIIDDVQAGPEDTSLLAPPRVPLVQHHLVTFRIKRSAPNGDIPLPGYLCGDQMSSVPLMVNPPRLVPETMKTVELTPTIAQMITLNSKEDTINLRLMSRNTLKPYRLLDLFQSKIEYIYPPYWFGWPEHILYYWPEPPEPLDDEQKEEKLEKYLVLPMYQGLPVVPVRQDTTLPPGQVKCAREARRENGAAYSFFMSPGKLSADMLLEQPTTLCESTDVDCAAMRQACLGAGVSEEECSTITTKPRNDLSCETTKLPLKKGEVPAACEGKMQWVVMDRHNLVYPVGTKVNPIPLGTNTFMLPTTAGTRIFAQKDSNLRMGENAPVVRLEEGGTLLLEDGSKLKMLPPAEVGIVSLGSIFRIKLALNTVKLEGGGMLLDKNGNLKATYEKGKNLSVLAVVPYVVNLNRSFTIPETYEYPSASKDPQNASDPLPYAKLPLDANPTPVIVKFKPRILPGFFGAIPRQPVTPRQPINLTPRQLTPRIPIVDEPQ